jgi:hypothetical protein
MKPFWDGKAVKGVDHHGQEKEHSFGGTVARFGKEKHRIAALKLEFHALYSKYFVTISMSQIILGTYLCFKKIICYLPTISI